MKAKIKATGEILKVADYATITMENCDSYGSPLEYTPESVVLIDDTSVKNNIDWEERRWELIKASFQGFLIHKGSMSDDLLVNRVFELADAVLEKYRKGGKE